MAKKNVQEICKLCLQYRELQKSHYLPKALYRLCRQHGQNPIIATSTVVDFSQKQMRKHLLCKECEDLLSKRGESYTLDMVHRGDRIIFLRDCEDQLLLMNRHFLESAEDRTSISRLH